MWLAEGNSPKNLLNKRIFIVEDNLENRIIMQLSLIRSGADLEFDRWGRDSVKRLERQLPLDLILLDLMLPFGESGYNIFDQIRQQPVLADIPIAAISAADPSVAIPKCRQKGFDGFIAKPINDDIFADQLFSLMNGEEVWYSAHEL